MSNKCLYILNCYKIFIINKMSSWDLEKKTVLPFISCLVHKKHITILFFIIYEKHFSYILSLYHVKLWLLYYYIACLVSQKHQGFPKILDRDIIIYINKTCIHWPKKRLNVCNDDAEEKTFLRGYIFNRSFID